MTLKAGTIVRRDPGTGMYPHVKAEILRVDRESTDHKGLYLYIVRMIDGPQPGNTSSWNEKFFHVVEHVVPEKVEVGGVTTTRREVLLNPERGGGMKFDGGKPQPRLLHQGMPRALAEVVKTLTFGAQKYAADSWQTVPNAMERYQDASYRHDSKRCEGELVDPETGISHRAHHIINELFLLELELRAEAKDGAE